MNDNRKSITLRLPKELHQQLAIHRALTGETMNATVIRILREWKKTKADG